MENTKVLDIIAHTLSLIDMRLIDHGKNVALLTYHAMKASKKYSDKEINDMCLIAVFHDIGAFKTDEISNLVTFDAENAWEHSVYGYLFIKHFSPLSYLAPVILFHHTSMKYMDSVPYYYRELAQILHIADRMEIASRFGGMSSDMLVRHLTDDKHEVFSQELLQLFFEFGDEEFIDHDELWRQLGGIIQSRADISEYLKMLVLSIDFRSRHTVNHTVVTAELSRHIANLFNFSSIEVEHTTYGALLHDLGKAAIPTEILENPGRLNDEEMSIMKAHIIFTSQILKGRVNQVIERIADRHHEKLDGSGYPNGLDAAQLTLPERIVAVADILSALSGARSYKDAFPKDKVISILTGMSENGQIDSVVVQKITENYDFLMSESARATRPVTQNYNDLSMKYDLLLSNIIDMQKTNHYHFESFAKILLETEAGKI